MRRVVLLLVLLVTVVLGAPAAWSQVPVPTQPPDTAPTPDPTSPPATDPEPEPEPEPTTPPQTTPAPTRPRTTVTRTGRTTTTSSTIGPTTTLFVIPGQSGPQATQSPTTFAPVVQNDELPTWSTNLFWIGLAGALTIMVTTFVMTGRGGGTA